MWQVWVFDAPQEIIDSRDLVPSSEGLEYFTLWSECRTQESAIEVRNDLMREGAYARVIWKDLKFYTWTR